MSNRLRIGELAKRTHCDIPTIRYYEHAGLLPKPERSEGNYRVYGVTQVQRLSFIRHCRSLDMGLHEIRVLLRFRDAPEKNCGVVNALLEEHIGHVATRIAELERLETQLKNLRRRCREAQAVKDCGILNALSRDKTTRGIRVRTGLPHIQGTHARTGK